jgi:hypothetical protein
LRCWISSIWNGPELASAMLTSSGEASPRKRKSEIGARSKAKKGPTPSTSVQCFSAASMSRTT